MKKTVLFIFVLSVVFFSGCTFNETAEIQEQTVQLVIASRKSGIESLKTIVKLFEMENNGIQIKLLDFSAESDGGHQFLSSVLRGNEIQLDIFEIEDVWLHEFAKRNYLLSLNEAVNLDSERYVGVAVDGMSQSGELYGVPMEIDVGVLFSKKSLHDADVKWNGLLLGAQKFDDYSIQGSDGEDMLCTLMEIIKYCENDVYAGLEVYHRMVSESKSTLDDDYLTLFKTGKVDLTRAWISNEASLSDNLSKVKGNFNVSKLPELPEKTDMSTAYAKRYGYALNSNTEYKAEALKFLQFLTREDVQHAFIKKKRVWPVLKKLYFDPIINDYVRYIEQDIKKVEGLNYRIQLENYSELAYDAKSTLRSFLNDEIIAEEAIDYIEKLMVE